MRIYVAIVIGMTLLASGCAHMRPGDVAMVKPVSDPDKPRAGNVYLLRGWIGIFSSGIDDLTSKINTSGVRAHVYQDDQWRSLAKAIKQKYKGVPNPEPLILVGHSYGADDVVRVARDVGNAGIKVDLLVTLDPVTPPHVPANVRLCQNYYRTGFLDSLPVLRGVPLKKAPNSPVALNNLNINTNRKDLAEPNSNHFNIEKNQKVHAAVLNDILASCPQRNGWAYRPAPSSATPTPRTEPSTINASIK